MLRLFKQYYPIRNAIFVLGEGLLIFSAVIIACLIFFGKGNVSLELSDVYKALLITVIFQICLFYNDLYDLKITDSLTELSIRLVQAIGASSIVLALIYWIYPIAIIKEGIFIASILIIIFLVVSWRIIYARVLSVGMFNQKIILLGSSDTAKTIFREINEKKDCGYHIAAVVSKEQWNTDLAENEQIIVQHVFNNICNIAEENKVKKIVVALKEKRGQFPAAELLECKVSGIEVLDGNSFYEMLTGRLIVEEINPSWLIFSKGFEKSRFKRMVKRIIDLTISLTLLIVLSPVILITALVIKLDSKGPVVFSQERVGKRNKPYMVHKFRSMKCDAEKETGPVWAKDNDDRITRVGRFMRKWRVDEIPQLWNVLKGEMSFVGPRPEREHFVKQLKEIIPYYSERFTVKPGLTGWAQVSYGYGASVRDAIEKLNYDLFYIKNMSTLFDLMIVFKTVKTVLFGMGR
jgi:sugar transferase (PEP-CTERM system associated)